MRTIAPEIAAQIAKRDGLSVRQLFWIVGKNRSTGVDEAMGVWNGYDTATFVIDGTPRTYVGGGGFLQLGNLKQAQGLNIQTLTASASPISPEFQAILREYNSRMARVEIHEVFFNPIS